MKRREIIATLIEVSNDLDSMGMFAEADVLTKTAESFGHLSPFEPEANPDNDATEAGFLGEEQYEKEQEAMQALRNEETLIELEARIEELKRNPRPTHEDLVELDRLLDYRMGQSFDSANVTIPGKETEFATRLQDAGADVSEPDLNDPFRDE